MKLPDYECDTSGCYNRFSIADSNHGVLKDLLNCDYFVCISCHKRILKLKADE